MKYFVTLVGKDTYAFNKNRFVKDERQEVSMETYNAVKCSPLFMVEVEGVHSTDTTDMINETVVSDETMNIVLAYSPNWAQHVRLEVFALFKNNPPPIKVFLLSDTLGNIDLQPICDFFGRGYSYEYLDVESLYKEKIPSTVNVSNRFTKYTLYRLLMPLLLDVDRLLYIDTDAIVCGNIKNFYHMDLKDNILAGVPDIGVAMPAVRKNINFSTTDVYINAGVTLMDLKKIKKLNLVDTWLQMVNEKFYACHDQDILNITCKNKIHTVSNNYNNSLSTGLHAKDIKIMHYAGRKPWNTVDVPHYEIWRRIEEEYRATQLPCIPKKIHYCWFGGKEKPELVKKCIDSWKEHMPDYEIIEWNENNFDLTAHGSYVKDAADARKWAFVTDYVRLWALYKFGGIYMDGDVQVFKPLDRFLKHRAFTGHETDDLLVTATMGAEPEHPWIKHLLSFYDTAKFGTTPNTQTITKMSQSWILMHENGFRLLKEDVVIYPIETFCSYDHKNLKAIPTNNSYAVHLFAGTWVGRTKI